MTGVYKVQSFFYIWTDNTAQTKLHSNTKTKFKGDLQTLWTFNTGSDELIHAWRFILKLLSFILNEWSLAIEYGSF